MRKRLMPFMFLLVSMISFAQTKSTETIDSEIKQIINENTFMPELSNGVTKNAVGKEVPFNLSYYYFLDSEALFSVIYQQHDEVSLTETFYFEGEKIILIIIEKINNKVSKNRITEQILYYYTDGQLLNYEAINEKYDPEHLYLKGMENLAEFNKKATN